MDWPSDRVSQGGLFHPRKANYNPDTHDFLKVLINESKLSSAQRDKGRYFLRSNEASSDIAESQFSSSEVALTRPGSSKRRSRDTIVNSGAYEREKFIPKLPKFDRDQAKKHLQDLMAYGKDVMPIPPPLVAPKPKNTAPQENRFDQLEREILERKEFLKEMKELGEGSKYEQIIDQQIQAKLREMKKLEVAGKCKIKNN